MGSDETLSRYNDACQGAADDYIERSTRFGAADLKVLGASSQSRSFRIGLRHSLEVISDARDYQGVVKPGGDDLSTADWAWYQQQVLEQSQSELAREETLKELVAAVRAKPYAVISDKTCVRTHPRRLFHTYKCGDCHGSGQLTCDGCGGSGTVSCSSCGGGGRVRCSACGGSGSVLENHQVRDYTGHYRTESRHRPCYNCSGGRVRCSGCGGSGRNTCRACGGSGHVTCGNCGGHGYLTRITSTSTYTLPEFHGFYPDGTPDYVHKALCKAGFSNLEQYGVIEFETVETIPEHARADFKYLCVMSFCELSLDVAGHRSTWVLYGEPPRIYDAGGTLEALLKEDFMRLDELGAGWLRMLPWFHCRARRVITLFMESEVHQEIVNADHQGFASTAIVEKVNRSLSVDYIERSLRRLRQTVQAAGHWSSLKWTVGIAVAVIPIIIFGVALMERAKPHTMLTTQDRLILFPWITGPQTPWVIVFVTLPLSFVGWLIAKWISKRWIKRAGGKQLVDWAHRKGLLIGKWTAIATIAATAMAGAYFFDKWPVWVDSDGRLYGVIAILQQPQLIEPATIQPKGLENLRSSHKSRRGY